MAKIIFENQIEDFLESLTARYRVVVPAIEHEKASVSKIVFKEYCRGQGLALSYALTNLPPKEFLIPPKDILFEFEDNKKSIPSAQKTIIFGLSYEDLGGLNRLKVVFEKPIAEEQYLNKSANTILVALDHFSPPKDLHFDLYFQKIKTDTYAVFAKTISGRKLLSPKFFKDHAIKIPKVAKKKDSLLESPELPQIIKKAKNHPIWEELAQICFGCGICSYVCPLCYCFETEDEILWERGKLSGRRCRTWDSCLLSPFAAISNHNFRPELSRRLYNWYYHKFVRMPKEYGFNGCVDCHRCSVFCPAQINYRVVLEQLRKDYGGKK